MARVGPTARKASQTAIKRASIRNLMGMIKQCNHKQLRETYLVAGASTPTVGDTVTANSMSPSTDIRGGGVPVEAMWAGDELETSTIEGQAVMIYDLYIGIGVKHKSHRCCKRSEEQRSEDARKECFHGKSNLNLVHRCFKQHLLIALSPPELRSMFQ